MHVLGHGLELVDGRAVAAPEVRHHVLDQRQLEAWIKASRQPLLPRGANEYLFGALGSWPTLNVVAAQSRGTIISVFVNANVPLGPGLAFVDVGACSHLDLFDEGGNSRLRHRLQLLGPYPDRTSRG